jgi:predicted RNase H-like HicB family nuclease
MNPSIAVKAAWDPKAEVFYIAYNDLLGLNVEAKTIDELRERLPRAIQDLTGRQVPFNLIEPGNDGQSNAYSEQELMEGWIAESNLTGI